MGGRLASLRAMVRERGPLLALLYIIHRILGRITGGRARIVPYRLVAQPIGQGVSVRDDPHYVVSLIGPGHPFVASLPRPPEVNAVRWSSGAHCYALAVKADLAGTIWIQRKAYVEDEVRCRYVLVDPAHSVWDFDVYVIPRLRLGRAMARLWKAVDADLAAQGVTWSFSRISMFNPESLNSHARLGARGIGWAVFACFGPWQAALFSNRPWLPRISVVGTPEIQLHPPA